MIDQCGEFRGNDGGHNLVTRKVEGVEQREGLSGVSKSALFLGICSPYLVVTNRLRSLGLSEYNWGPSYHVVAVAQLVEHGIVIPGVAGSIPVSHPNFLASKNQQKSKYK